ncbi:hypothetical protein SDIAM26S_05437 [Streptomyces diastaticus subsp. diastaticus]
MIGPSGPVPPSPATGAGAFPGVRFSVLDRSRVREGRPVGEALRETVALAREAERLGYHRFWVSEHHGVPESRRAPRRRCSRRRWPRRPPASGSAPAG